MAIESKGSIWAAESFGMALLDRTIGDLLDAQEIRYADREALVFKDTEFGIDVRWTYSDLLVRVDRLARGLIGLGIEAGDLVGLLAPNLPEWLLLEYALAKIGAVLVTVNTAYRQHELDYLLRQGRVRALFMVVGYRGNPYLENLRAIQRENKLPNLDFTILIGGGEGSGTVAFADILSRGDDVTQTVLQQRQAGVRPRDIVQIQYTSGTTGAPKGVMLTHHGVVNNANLMSLRAGWTEHDRLLAVMPLFHTAGSVMNALGMLTRGGTLLSLVTFDATKVLAMIVAENATIISAVPTMYLRLLAEPGVREGRYVPSSLRIALIGGTAVEPMVLQDVNAAFGTDPVAVMGMTEASPLITQTLPADSFDLCSTTAGIPLPFTAIKVIDVHTGDPVPAGQAGELCIRGYSVTPGYFDMPEQTSEAVDADGWLHSGDLATLDADGYLRIVGRAKDMIIRGGENIYPVEIENLLTRHPMVEQV